MTELLCHTDSYMEQFEAKVVTVLPDNSGVVLDCTAFYPGGQPCNFGWLGETAVVKISRDQGQIVHRIEGLGEP